MVKTINADLCAGIFKSIAGNSFFLSVSKAALFFLEKIIPAGIIKSPSNKNPGKIIYMNSPRYVSLLLNKVEIRKSTMIIRRFVEAINAPIIVIQFLLEENGFISNDIKV